MATDFKSPLGGILDYLVPDQIEKMAISGFAQNPNPVNKQGNPLYGGFTPDVDPNNPTGLSNIQTLLGNAYFPQTLNYGAGKGPTNKQMIDASILRAGLELGKGRLPGENFGVAFNRGMEAFGAPAKTLADHQAKLAASRASRQINYVSTMKYLDDRYGNNEPTINQALQKLGGYNSLASSYAKSEITRAAAAIIGAKGEVAASQYQDQLQTEMQTLKEIDGNFVYQGTDPVIIEITNNLNRRKEDFEQTEEEISLNSGDK